MRRLASQVDERRSQPPLLVGLGVFLAPLPPELLRRLLLDAIGRAGDDDEAAGCLEMLLLDPDGAPTGAFVIA